MQSLKIKTTGHGHVGMAHIGFGVVRLVGIDPDEAQVGDIAVEVAHSGFYTRAQVWLKVIDGARGGHRPQTYRTTFTSPPILRKIAPSHAERQRALPRLGDIWIHKSAVSPNHFVRLYIPGVEDLFQEGDRLLRVEHSGSRSRLISWRVWRSKEGEWRFQQESMDEHKFTTVPSIIAPLKPIAEGA
jgi:hypothetical protein